MLTRLSVLVVLCASVFASGPLSRVTKAEELWLVEKPAERDARMEWWRDARFGMFIHWGLYAIPAGEWEGKPVGGIGEWIMDRANIPVERVREAGQAVQPGQVRRGRVGADRQGRRHEVHRDHVQAPRRLLPVRHRRDGLGRRRRRHPTARTC